jgi:copper chaperone CopZ
MTSERYTRCEHCGDVYLYLVSGGPGYNTNHTNGRHCEICSTAIINALKQIPRKFISKTVDISDLSINVTLDDLLRWESENKAEVERLRSSGKIIGARVAFPLFDLSDPENRNHARHITATDGQYKGVDFILSTWSKREDYQVTVKAEYDCINQKLVGLWKNYERLY